MKRLLVLCLLAVLLWTPKIRAELASEAEMDRVCQNWLSVMIHEKGGWAGSTNPQIGGVHEIVGRDGTILGRSYSITPNGYVVVPVLKELPPVKSYSEEYELDVAQPGGFPVMLREILEQRATLFVQRYGSLQASQPATGDVLYGRRHRAVWDRLTAEPTMFTRDLDAQRFETMVGAGPLLTTSWDQNSPYNNQCPMGDGGQSVVGCVATAAAQIMKYHEWPSSGVGSHSYAWDGDQSCSGDVGGGTLSAFFSDPYDWANMPDNCNTGCSAVEEDALAELSHEVGIAFEMDYGHCGSGTNTEDALTVFPTYFRYESSIDQEYRKFHTASSWFTVIQDEINSGRPMLYRIRGQDAGDPEEGHAFVCDGWRVFSNLDQYHMNYGWGGPFTDWYTLDDYFCPWDTCFQGDEFVIRAIEPREPTIWHVNPSGTGDAPTIQAGIDSAAPGDVLLLASGAYVGTGNYSVDLPEKEILIQAEDGYPESCVIDCGGLGRGFFLDSTEGVRVSMSGLTIRNGTADYGGAIFCNGASLSVSNCVFENNVAAAGGGIWLDNGGPIIQTATIVGSKFHGNQATGYAGGGLAAYVGVTVNISSCEFVENSSDWAGAVAFVYFNVNGTIDNCQFIDNSSTDRAGAVTLDFGQSTLTACTFSGNTAASTGGAVMVHFGKATMDGCTFSENSASSGGAIWVEGDQAELTLQKTIIAFGQGGAAVGCDTGDELLSVDCCNIHGNLGGDWVGCILTQLSLGQGNMSLDPLFCNSLIQDFRLAPESPCLPSSAYNTCAQLIGAHGEGCGVVGVHGDVGSVFETELKSAYPNPFNPTTTIAFSIAKQIDVHVAIYDIRGALVKTLVKDSRELSNYKVVWDGRNNEGQRVASGVYFCRLVAGDYHTSKKIVLLK